MVMMRATKVLGERVESLPRSSSLGQTVQAQALVGSSDQNAALVVAGALLFAVAAVEEHSS